MRGRRQRGSLLTRKTMKSLALIPFLAAAQIPMPDPTPVTWPDWVNVPPITSSSWLTSGNAPWDYYWGEFVTEDGPSAHSPTPLPGFTLSSVWIDPQEFQQSGTNVFCTLAFFYQYWPHGSSSASVRINGTPRYTLPQAQAWTRFQTNLSVSAISKLEFGVYNGASQQASPVLMIDAVAIHPIWTPVPFDIQLVVGNPTRLRWSATKYDATWKLFGQSKLNLPFVAIPGTPTLQNGYWSQQSHFANTNEFYQLRKP